jgi:hypothetical protein
VVKLSVKEVSAKQLVRLYSAVQLLSDVSHPDSCSWEDGKSVTEVLIGKNRYWESVVESGREAAVPSEIEVCHNRTYATTWRTYIVVQ